MQASRGHAAKLLHSPLCWLACLALLPLSVMGHDISSANADFVQQLEGIAVIPFMYLGAKHMVTGYDHLLYLLGVVFFLYRVRDVIIFVTLFTLGHSLTLMLGVLLGLNVNAYLIDMIIGLSVAYKAFENIGGFQEIFKVQLNPKWAVFIFGLFHGLGLATKVQGLSLSTEGLIINMLSFNLGVEIGQALALLGIVMILTQWRRQHGFHQQALASNTLLMCAGFILASYQLASYFWA